MMKKRVVHGKASSKVEFYMEKSMSVVYGKRQLPVPLAKNLGSKTRKLSSSMQSTRKRREKPQSAVEAARKTEQ